MLTALIHGRRVRWAKVAIVAALGIPSAALPQSPAANADSTNKLPLAPGRVISFVTDEGTWISLDVSPDGKQIVFDLLGDIYLMPIEGGEAKRLTSGMPWDMQPVFSPDGRSIAFVSDRSGSDNVWTMSLEGTGLDAVTTEQGAIMSSPEWLPDGNYLVARRGPDPMPIRQAPLWMYHKDLGRGFQIYPQAAQRPNPYGPPQQSSSGSTSAPSFSADGRMMYFTASGGGYGGGALQTYQVMALDRVTGKTEQLTSEYGGGLRPIVSPDGRYLVYARRRDAETALRIRDLRTQKEEWLAAAVQRDDQEGFGWTDWFPGYSFTPDSKSVVFTADGKIKRVDIATKTVRTIPFSAKVELPVANRLRAKQSIESGPMAVRQLLWVNLSSDGGRAAFTAVGKAWIANLADGSARRLTNGALRELMPALSPDGRWVVYVERSDSGGARLMKVASSGGTPVALTAGGGEYRAIGWSPNGDKLVYYGQRAVAGCDDCNELAWIAADGGDSHLIAKVSGSEMGEVKIGVISTPRDGERIYYSEGRWNIVSSKLDGSDKRTHLKISTETYLESNGALSPDGKWALLLNGDQPYVVAVPDVGTDGLSISPGGAPVPSQKLTTHGAYSVSWADGGKTVVWTFGNRVYRAPLAEILAAKSPDSIRAKETVISFTVPRAVPSGRVYLTGARIITMRGDEVIDDGDILIEGNKIVAIGPSSTMDPPADVRVIDVHGKTIMPGLVDVHAHPWGGGGTMNALLPDQQWALAANLAYGVTTMRDPSGTRGTFWWHELVEAGEAVGPRVYGVGVAIVPEVANIGSYEHALEIVRLYKSQGANSLKEYMQPRRIQRQWMRMAAEAEGINVTNEGGSDLKRDLTFALDGMTGTEHSLPIVPIYRDVIELLARTGITYTPTLIVAYGGLDGEQYWVNHWDMHNDKKLRRFTPHQTIDDKWRRRESAVDDEYVIGAQAKAAAQVVRSGGHVGLGSHGNDQGIGAQWEIWSLAAGGMTPLEAIRVSTLFGAESIGLDDQLGSLEVGKLADLLVLDGNPLEDIRSTNTIRYVVKNGVVYDGDTLDEVWPTQRKFPIFDWARDDDGFEALKGSQR